MKTLVVVILVVHGLVVLGNSLGVLNSSPIAQNPKWLKWWPTRFGESWLLKRLGLARTGIAWLTGLVWWLSGLLLILAGLGILGFLLSADTWRGFAIAGAALSLIMLLVYLHPAFIVGVLLSLAILISLLVLQWPPAGFI